ncbi:MAG: hypothetical protein O7A06_02720 [Acidobacteria bacterium]|nr:hypothetical protein [Acidobacteriota bacterium]
MARAAAREQSAGRKTRFDHWKKDGFVLFYGWAHDSKEHTIYRNEEHGGDWTVFLASA